MENEKKETATQKYRRMMKLYQQPYAEKEALELARELMTADLPTNKMKDVEHIYFMTGGK